LIAYDKELKPAEAKDHFAKAVELAPDDVPTRMRYSEALKETGDEDGAIRELEVVHQRGIEFAGAFYQPAIYRLSRLLRGRKKGDDVAASTALSNEHKKLADEHAPEAQRDDIQSGNLARVRVPPPAPHPGEAPKSAPPVAFPVTGAPLLAQAG